MLQPQERLRLAVVDGNLAIAKRLLSRFPELWLNIDYQNNGWSNLHYASSSGNYLVCFHLISLYNQWQSRHTEFRISPLDLLAFDHTLVIHLAAQNHHIQTLHYLLQEFPGPLWLNAPGGCHSRTPLHLSCIKGFQEGIKLLVEYGADPTAADGLGNTSLHYLFEYDHMECAWSMFKLIILGAKSKEEARAVIARLELIRNNSGCTALDFVATQALKSQYKRMKDHLLAQDLHDSSLDLTDLMSRKSAVIVDDSKSVSSKSTVTSQANSNKFPGLEDVRSTYPSREDAALVTKRAHSQSLPTDLPEPAKISEHSTRRRSNTTISKTSIPTPQTPTVSTGVFAKPQPPPLKSITISPTVRNSTFSREDHSPPMSPQSISTSSNSSIYTSSSPSHYRRKYSNNNSFMATPTFGSIAINELRPFSPVVSLNSSTGVPSTSGSNSTVSNSGVNTPSRTEPAPQPSIPVHHQIFKPLPEMIPLFTSGGHIAYQPPRPMSMTVGSTGSSSSSSSIYAPTQHSIGTSKEAKQASNSSSSVVSQKSSTKSRSHTLSNPTLDTSTGSLTTVNMARSSSTLAQTNGTRVSRGPSKVSSSSSLLASTNREPLEPQSAPSKRNTVSSISFSRIR